MAYVAVTDINYGNEDGSKTVIRRGETVEGLDDKVMDELYALGSIVDEDSDDNPNNLEDTNDAFATTPRVVEESLRAQIAGSNSPSGTVADGALTQPNAEPVDDPQALLDGVNAETVAKTEKAAEEKPATKKAAPAPAKSES